MQKANIGQVCRHPGNLQKRSISEVAGHALPEMHLFVLFHCSDHSTSRFQPAPRQDRRWWTEKVFTIELVRGGGLPGVLAHAPAA